MRWCVWLPVVAAVVVAAKVDIEDLLGSGRASGFAVNTDGRISSVSRRVAKAQEPTAFRRRSAIAVTVPGKQVFGIAPLTGALFERYYAGPDHGWQFIPHALPKGAVAQAVLSPRGGGVVFAVTTDGRVFRHDVLDRVSIQASTMAPVAVPVGSRRIAQASTLMVTETGSIMYMKDTVLCNDECELVGMATPKELRAARNRGVIVDGHLWGMPAVNASTSPWVEVSPAWHHVMDFAVETPMWSMMFVTTVGELAEYIWGSNEWHVTSLHSQHAGLRVVVDAYTLKGAAVFAVTSTGELVERTPTGLWAEHGHPEGAPLAASPGVVLRDTNAMGSLFLRTQSGQLVERWWCNDDWEWRWVDHGAPPGTTLVTAPGALVNASSLFVVGADGTLRRRHWSPAAGAWEWSSHGRPPGGVALAFVRPEAVHANLVVAFRINGDMADLVFTGEAWVWEVRPTPESRHPGAPYACALRPPRAQGCLSLSSKAVGAGSRSESAIRALVDPRTPPPPAHAVDLAPGPWKPSTPEELAATLVSAIAPSVFCLSLTGNVFERFFNDMNWVYVSHMNPSDHPVLALSTVRGGTGSFFASDLNGRLFQRVVDVHSDLSRLMWLDVTAPGSRFFTPGTQSLAGNLYFVDAQGTVLERDVMADSWQVVSGAIREAEGLDVTVGATMAVVADAYTLKLASLWTVTTDGELMELETCCGWTRHGAPPGGRALARLPAVSLRDVNAIGSMFFKTTAATLVEWHFDKVHSGWHWVDHGAPKGTTVASAPGALVSSTSFFVVGGNGRLYERRWRNSWKWVDHGAPPGEPLAAARPGHLTPSIVVTQALSGKLAVRLQDHAQWRWTWEVNDVPIAGVRDLGELASAPDVVEYCSQMAGPMNCIKGSAV